MSAKEPETGAETGAAQSVRANYKKIGKFEGYRSNAFLGFDSPPETYTWQHFNIPSWPSRYVPLRFIKSFEQNDSIFADCSSSSSNHEEGGKIQTESLETSDRHRSTKELVTSLFGELSEKLKLIEVRFTAVETMLKDGSLPEKVATGTPEKQNQSVEIRQQMTEPLPKKELQLEAPRDSFDAINEKPHTQEDENIADVEESVIALKAHDEAQGSSEDIEKQTPDQDHSTTTIGEEFGETLQLDVNINVTDTSEHQKPSVATVSNRHESQQGDRTKDFSMSSDEEIAAMEAAKPLEIDDKQEAPDTLELYKSSITSMGTASNRNESHQGDPTAEEIAENAPVIEEARKVAPRDSSEKHGTEDCSELSSDEEIAAMEALEALEIDDKQEVTDTSEHHESSIASVGTACNRRESQQVDRMAEEWEWLFDEEMTDIEAWEALEKAIASHFS